MGADPRRRDHRRAEARDPPPPPDPTAPLEHEQPAVLQPGENPWLNELTGSQRAAARGLKVGLIVLDWFASVSAGGELNASGRAMVSAAGRAMVSAAGHVSHAAAPGPDADALELGVRS